MQTVAIPTATRYGIVQASKIIGEGVLNPQNDELGKIHDIVIDAKDRPRLLCRAFGGRLSGNRQQAIRHALERFRVLQLGKQAGLERRQGKAEGSSRFRQGCEVA
jgi:hypothetical protein